MEDNKDVTLNTKDPSGHISDSPGERSRQTTHKTKRSVFSHGTVAEDILSLY